MVAVAAGTGREFRALGLIGTGHFLSHLYQLALPPLFPLIMIDLDANLAGLGAAMAAYSVSTGGLQTPGDINQDGNLNLSDAVAVLTYLFQGNPAELPCGDGTLQDEANRLLLDSDGGGAVHMADAIYLLNYLYQGGVPPVLGTGCVRIPGCEDACGP